MTEKDKHEDTTISTNDDGANGSAMDESIAVSMTDSDVNASMKNNDHEDIIVSTMVGNINGSPNDEDVAVSPKDGDVNAEDIALSSRDNDINASTKKDDHEDTTVSTTDGDINASAKDEDVTVSSDGDVNASTKNGDHAVSMTDGNVNGSANDEDVAVSQKDGDVNASTKDEDVAFDHEETTVSTTDGDVNAEDIALSSRERDINASTKKDDDEDITVSTTDGDVNAEDIALSSRDNDINASTKKDGDEDITTDGNVNGSTNDEYVTVSSKDGDVVVKAPTQDENLDQDSNVLSKDEDVTEHEDDDATVLAKDDDEDVTEHGDKDLTVLAKDEDVAEHADEGSNALTKDEDGDAAVSTKVKGVNAVMDLKPWKAFSITQMFDYQGYWTTIADKCTRWKESTQQTMAKDLKKSWEAQSKNFRWSVIATLLLLIISIFISVWNRSSSNFMEDVNYVCQSPRVIQPWQIKAFHPKWFGLFGSPGPITYKTKGRKGHQVAIVDIDRRDIEIAVSVDGKKFSHKPVALDNTVSCGEDLSNCINMGFGAAVISVPPGKHMIKAEIRDINGTFRWEHERKRRVWWMVEECS